MPGTAAVAADGVGSSSQPGAKLPNTGRVSSAPTHGGELGGKRAVKPAPMIAGAAAMVAGGPAVPKKVVTAKKVESTVTPASSDEVSPRTAKKVLPHFLAIGNPGSQALVPKEGAEMVQRQARGG